MSRHSKLLQTPRTACRIPLFAATRRGRAVIQQRVETSWGWAVVTGRLHQCHRDVLDFMMATADAWRPVGAHGDMIARIDSSRLRGELGWDRWTYRQILDALRDLRAAEIASSMGEWTGVLTHIIESGTAPAPRRGMVRKKGQVLRVKCPVPGGPARGGMVWEVTVSGAWIALAREAVVRYPITVTRMRYGVSQAVSRLMLSHSPGAHYAVETALTAVGIQTKRHQRAMEEMRQDAVLMAAAGVALDPVTGTVTHVDHTTPVIEPKAGPLDHTTPVADHTTPVADHTTPAKTTQPRSL